SPRHTFLISHKNMSPASPCVCVCVCVCVYVCAVCSQELSQLLFPVCLQPQSRSQQLQSVSVSLMSLSLSLSLSLSVSLSLSLSLFSLFGLILSVSALSPP